MAKPLILVAGATGTVGSEVVRQLAEAGEHVRALVRNPEKTKAFGNKIEVVQGDLEEPETLAPVFAGVEKAFIGTVGPKLAIMEGNAYDAAEKAGVTHIVKLSGRHADADWMLDMPLARWHRDSEQRLRSSGMSWTIVRPGSFASNFLMWLDRKQMGVFLPVGKGKDSFIDPRDIGAVMVKALTAPGHAGAIYEITGAQQFDFTELTGQLSAVIGKPVHYSDIPEAHMREGLKASGLHPDYAESLLCYFSALKNGKLYKPTSTVAGLLGRPPYSFENWARHNASAFA